MFAAAIGLVAALFVVIPVVFSILAILASVFSGVAVLLVAGAFAGKGVLIGAVLGFIAYRAFRKARIAQAEESME